MELVLLIFCITLLILVALICANLVKKGGALDKYGNEMDIEILLDTKLNSLNSIRIYNLADNKFNIYSIYELRAIALSLIKNNYNENTNYYNRFLKLKEADCIGSNMSYELIIENIHAYGKHSEYEHVSILCIALRLIDDEINKVKEVINSANIVVNIDNDEINKILAPLYETFDKFKTILKNNNNVILDKKILDNCKIIFDNMIGPVFNEKYESYYSLLESFHENIYKEINKIKRIITTVPENIIANMVYFIDYELNAEKKSPIRTINKRIINDLKSPVALEDLSRIFETLYLDVTFKLFHELIQSEPTIKTIVSLGSGNAALEFILQEWINASRHPVKRNWILIEPDETSYHGNNSTVFIKPDYKYCDDMLKERPELRQNCILLLNCIDPHQNEETAYDLQCVETLKPRCIFFITNTELSSFTSGTSYLKNYLDSPSSDYKLIDMYKNKYLNNEQAALVFKPKTASIFPPIKPIGEIFSPDQKIKR